ncbi:hypothetical protein EUGRSUZ_F03440 [Eucalyptus grandis]|uniref:Uncharacterized protein n=2 Tax=Eucalyptus grandis TaxID=71139 RepID=A0ACC3KLK2_EUCGR|nr:hypothetical protein EUGRSUZ_F03440 [Eucalyptus grandis]
MGESKVDRNDMSDSRTTDHAEESSWTMYLGDFSIDKKKKSLLISSDNNSSSLVSDAASSLVSDATSSMTRVFGDGTRMVSCKSISFKKESQDSIIQDALEDTASSLNYPKVRFVCMNVLLKEVHMREVCNKHPIHIPTEAKEGTLDGIHSRKDLDLIARDADRRAMKGSGPHSVPPSTYAGEA